MEATYLLKQKQISKVLALYQSEQKINPRQNVAVRKSKTGYNCIVYMDVSHFMID